MASSGIGNIIPKSSNFLNPFIGNGKGQVTLNPNAQSPDGGTFGSQANSFGTPNSFSGSTPSTGIFTPKSNVPVTASSYGILGTPGSTTVNTNATPSFGAVTPQQNVSSYPGYVNPSSVSSSIYGGSSGGNTGGNAGTDTASLQSQLAADKAALASAQAQQAYLNAPATTGDPTAKVTYPGLVSTLGQTASQPTQQYTTAEANANAAQADLQKLQAAQAQQDALIGGSRTNVSEAQGEAGLYNTQMIGQEQAAATALAGYQNQAGIATGQQTAQQQGLGTAAALAGPQAGNQFGTFNPLTMQYTGYGNGTSGGAATAGAVGTQVSQGSAVQQMTGTLAQATTLANTLSGVIKQSGINPLNASALTTFANGALQAFESGSGNPQYQNFNNLIGEISSRYASILNQAGGTPTDQSTLSHNILNSLANGASIQTVLGQLNANAQNSIDALNTASQSNATASGNSSSGSSGWSSLGD